VFSNPAFYKHESFLGRLHFRLHVTVVERSHASATHVL
jgi:hypothetical protein